MAIKNQIHKRLSFYQVIASVSALVFILFVVISWIRLSHFEVEIRQIELDELKRTDRCISCHNGLEVLLTTESMHPGEFLDDHPIEDFGCTICHGGQGLALRFDEAHIADTSMHWPEPLLQQPFLQSNCGKCHLAVFSGNHITEGMTDLIHGKDIFLGEGCMGCHKVRGVGGLIGPDLTEEGEKSIIEFDFASVAGKQSVANWLMEHFKDPESVSPGSQMLQFELDDKELESLTTFVMGLEKADFTYDYIDVNLINELKGFRDEMPAKKLFEAFCSACHGKEGDGKDYEEYNDGVASLKSTEFLSIASEEFIFFNIVHGRSGRNMRSWKQELSGLTKAELKSLRDYILNWQERNSTYREVVSNRGNAREGLVLYDEYCRQCHVKGIAVLHNNRDFLRFADNEYIYKTLIHGRKNTAMPSWWHLTAEDIADLLAYLRTMGAYQSSNVTVNEGNINEGYERFHYLCSRCHGYHGEGDTGPAILNKSFVRDAPKQFLYRTISKGRIHTLMLGWKDELQGGDKLSDDQIFDVISYMKSTIDSIPEYLYPGPTTGDPVSGKEYYENYCQYCHGFDGKGEHAPALNNQEFLNVATNGYLLATISLGRTGSEMPSWAKKTETHKKLTEKERLDIVAYLRSWHKSRIKMPR